MKLPRLSGQSGFTILEIIIVVVILGLLAGIATPIYVSLVEKPKQSEALLNMAAIRKAEFQALTEKGTFVNLEDTDEINRLMGLGVQEKFFSYKVIEATDSYFKIVATRLGEIAMDIAPIMITMGPSGSFLSEYRRRR